MSITATTPRAFRVSPDVPGYWRSPSVGIDARADPARSTPSTSARWRRTALTWRETGGSARNAARLEKARPVRRGNRRSSLPTARGSVRLRRPFLSANDRSRWCTIRALVEDGHARRRSALCDRQGASEPGWDTIDMVKHDGHGSGARSLYSSKPPAVTHALGGPVLGDSSADGGNAGHAPLCDRPLSLVALNNVLPLALALLAAGTVGRAIRRDRLGPDVRDGRGRLWHVPDDVSPWWSTTTSPAAVCAMIAIYAAVRIWFDGERRARYFVLAGLFAALAVADELPALALFAALSAALVWKAPRRTLARLSYPRPWW